MPNRVQRLVHPASGRVLAHELLVPRTFGGRALGLMLRHPLPPGTAMWIAPCSGIHTFFMRFAIDVIFVDRGLRVVRVRPGLRPWRLGPFVLGAHGVFELPAGTLAGLGLVRGELLAVEPQAAERER